VAGRGCAAALDAAAGSGGIAAGGVAGLSLACHAGFAR
jgi:hypothetical protein